MFFLKKGLYLKSAIYISLLAVIGFLFLYHNRISTGQIRPFIHDTINDKKQKLNVLLEKWKMFYVRWHLEVPMYNGKQVHYEGVTFEGSPQIVFWEFFDPYIKASCKNVMKTVFDYSKERNISLRKAKKETVKELEIFAYAFYSQMKNVDVLLMRRSLGTNTVSQKDISGKINQTKKYIKDLAGSYFYLVFWDKERIYSIILLLLGSGLLIYISIKINITQIFTNINNYIFK